MVKRQRDTSELRTKDKDKNEDEDEDDGYVPYISVAQRKKQIRERANKRRITKQHRVVKEKAEEYDDDDDDDENNNDNDNDNNNENDNDNTNNGSDKEKKAEDVYKDRSTALLDVAQKLRKEAAVNPELALAQKKREEARILETVTLTQTQALQSAAEKAKGVKYTESMQTGWKPTKKIREQNPSVHEKIRKKWHIIVDGEDPPPPIKSFKDMKFPKAILNGLAQKNIMRPTPIQVQGLPVALSGRDMIGIAFTGSGKTITFVLPMVMVALGEEMKLRIVGNEGPFGLILGPSRELQRQTFEVVQHFCDALKRGGFPELRCTLAIGGEDKRQQLREYQSVGTHMVVATPGRLNDFLNQKKMNLDSCKYMCLDEGDRMMDLGFDEEVQAMLAHFKGQRQTLLFSATMPKKIVDFAQTSLVRPVTVNVGRAGAANLDVIQEVEYVKQEAKIVYLLECLQKSPPPVVIFCERKNDVDDIHEYLLLKGVEAVAVHGGKDQSERNHAIQLFKNGKKDVLVATDVAAKGLDFPDIQHVINFDMPAEIENYVHRIGRTGRCGKTGVATTFINKNVEESVCLDLKHLLKEAKQRIPPILQQIEDPDEDNVQDEDLVGELGKGCSYCGALGHRITNCPKLQGVTRLQQSNMRDVVGGASYSGGW